MKAYTIQIQPVQRCEDIDNLLALCVKLSTKAADPRKHQQPRQNVEAFSSHHIYRSCNQHFRNRKQALFLSSYRDMSRSLGEREMLWEHEPQVSVSTAFSSSPKL